MKTETLLLLLVAAGAVYFITRPRAATLPMTTYPPGTSPVYNPYLQQQPNQVAQDITAGGIAAGGIADIINAFNNSSDS